MDGIKRVSRELVAKGSIIDYYHDKMEFPNGNTEVWDLIDHRGAAAVLAVREDGKILMVRQYRNALERDTLEIPAGGLNGEPTKIAALRELREETGYIAEDAQLLTSIYTTVAFCNEKIDIYLVENLSKKGDQDLDENEYVNVEAYTIDELVEMVKQVKIQDSKTVCAIMMYANRVKQ